MSKLSGAEFLNYLSTELDEKTKAVFDQAIDQYLIENHPVQYIVGYTYFYGYKMEVNDNVLIPRRETEELVGYVLATYDELFDGKKVKAVDVGTGSGNIAIAIKCEEPNIDMYATDISQEAINVAKRNAKNNNVEISFMVGDMLKPLIDNNLKFDLLVSNPPYIPDKEYVENIVKDNEPHIALFGGTEGMNFYEEILSGASKILNRPAAILFEHSYNKKAEMINLSNKYFPDSEVEVIKDLQGKDRFTIIKVK